MPSSFEALRPIPPRWLTSYGSTGTRKCRWPCGNLNVIKRQFFWWCSAALKVNQRKRVPYRSLLEQWRSPHLLNASNIIVIKSQFQLTLFKKVQEIPSSLLIRLIENHKGRIISTCIELFLTRNISCGYTRGYIYTQGQWNRVHIPTHDFSFLANYFSCEMSYHKPIGITWFCERISCF